MKPEELSGTRRENIWKNN